MIDNLQVIKDVKKTIIYLEKIIINFPNNDKVIKDKIMNTMFEILELTYISNENTGIERIKYQKKLTIKIKMIDFYLELACLKNYISHKKYQKVGIYLLNILKQIYGWIKSEKKKQFIQQY